MALQIRPKGHPDALAYAPDRDIAYCVPSLMHAVIFGLRPENWEPWYADYLQARGVTPEALAQAAIDLLKALQRMHLQEFRTPLEALLAAGFLKQPTPAQVVVCAKLGQVMACAFFSAVRDTTDLGAEPAQQQMLQRLQAAAEEQLRTDVEDLLYLTRLPAWRRWGVLTLRRLGWKRRSRE